MEVRNSCVVWLTLEVVDRVEFDLVSPLGCGTGDEVRDVDICGWCSVVEECCLERLAGTWGGKEGTVLGVGLPVEEGPEEVGVA